MAGTDPPVCPHCRSARESAELRYCRANNSAAWQCMECDRIIGGWIKHSDLSGVNVLTLPPWRYSRQGDLF